MLEYVKIDDVLEGIDVNKTNGFCECIIYYNWYFLETDYKFQPGVYNGCHYLMKKAISFTYVDVVTIKGNYYIIHFLYMSKYEAINLLRNADLAEKSGTS